MKMLLLHIIISVVTSVADGLSFSTQSRRVRMLLNNLLQLRRYWFSPLKRATLLNNDSMARPFASIYHPKYLLTYYLHLQNLATRLRVDRRSSYYTSLISQEKEKVKHEPNAGRRRTPHAQPTPPPTTHLPLTLT